MSHIKPIYNQILNIPMPSNISYLCNFGSILGILLTLQIITGLILSMHYSPHSSLAFQSILTITQDMNCGCILRFLHANMASLFFCAIYLHISRSLYFNSFFLILPCLSGCTLLILLMMTSFLGYILPCGQMSFCAATVITNLFSAIPLIGTSITQCICGDFSISNPTLNRFFSFHFILPFIMLLTSMIHISLLHITGSSNPMGTNSNLDKIPFNPYFTIKDTLGFALMIALILLSTLLLPFLPLNHDNFIQANPLNTPSHIQPECYFLFAYTILRSIPNKLGGVIALIMSVLILLLLPFYKPPITPYPFQPCTKPMFSSFITIFLLLTCLGSKPICFPYDFLGKMLTSSYFLFFTLYPYNK
uniref:Cytochrome b n=1 Tax=Linguatula serrata TaxID=646052 RepID=A0A385UJ03_9CRUS|nr:cytochrome b [Linguatula serrata]AYB71165.1 cytochrome b [Linguatula serrata]